MPTEKEKSQLGLLHLAGEDRELIEERLKCKNLCHEYNSLLPSKLKERDTLIRKIIGKTKEVFFIEQSFWCDYGYNIEVGENFYANHNLVILDCAKVTFGDNVFIAPNCGFYTPGHPLDVERRNEGLEFAYPIKIGNNVWIGGGVSVLPGVEIGDNTVIAAGSIVNKDIPPGVVAGGNPCRVIRQVAEADKLGYIKR